MVTDAHCLLPVEEMGEHTAWTGTHSSINVHNTRYAPKLGKGHLIAVCVEKSCYTFPFSSLKRAGVSILQTRSFLYPDRFSNASCRQYVRLRRRHNTNLHGRHAILDCMRHYCC